MDNKRLDQVDRHNPFNSGIVNNNFPNFDEIFNESIKNDGDNSCLIGLRTVSNKHSRCIFHREDDYSLVNDPIHLRRKMEWNRIMNDNNFSLETLSISGILSDTSMHLNSCCSLEMTSDQSDYFNSSQVKYLITPEKKTILGENSSKITEKGVTLISTNFLDGHHKFIEQTTSPTDMTVYIKPIHNINSCRIEDFSGYKDESAEFNDNVDGGTFDPSTNKTLLNRCIKSNSGILVSNDNQQIRFDIDSSTEILYENEIFTPDSKIKKEVLQGKTDIEKSSFSFFEENCFNYGEYFDASTINLTPLSKQFSKNKNNSSKELIYDDFALDIYKRISHSSLDFSIDNALYLNISDVLSPQDIGNRKTTQSYFFNANCSDCIQNDKAVYMVKEHNDYQIQKLHSTSPLIDASKIDSQIEVSPVMDRHMSILNYNDSCYNIFLDECDALYRNKKNNPLDKKIVQKQVNLSKGLSQLLIIHERVNMNCLFKKPKEISSKKQNNFYFVNLSPVSREKISTSGESHDVKSLKISPTIHLSQHKCSLVRPYETLHESLHDEISDDKECLLGYSHHNIDDILSNWVQKMQNNVSCKWSLQVIGSKRQKNNTYFPLYESKKMTKSFYHYLNISTDFNDDIDSVSKSLFEIFEESAYTDKCKITPGKLVI